MGAADASLNAERHKVVSWHPACRDGRFAFTHIMALPETDLQIQMRSASYLSFCYLQYLTTFLVFRALYLSLKIYTSQYLSADARMRR